MEIEINIQRLCNELNMDNNIFDVMPCGYKFKDDNDGISVLANLNKKPETTIVKMNTIYDKVFNELPIIISDATKMLSNKYYGTILNEPNIKAICYDLSRYFKEREIKIIAHSKILTNKKKVVLELHYDGGIK